MGFYFRSIRDHVFRVSVHYQVILYFVLHVMLLEPIPPLSTDCPEVIRLVNHSATVLVVTKLLILNHVFSEGSW
jgi:hypothetical protein